MLCKKHLNTSTKFSSSVTKESYCLNNCDNISLACNTKNVVYLVTCELCGVQYVGMTTGQLRSRFYGHRSSLRADKVHTWLYDHFRSFGHEAHHMKVQIIYHYSKNDDHSKEVLLTVEEFYMRKLTTLFPFGLNDNITSMNLNLSNTDFHALNQINTPFFSFTSQRRKRSHGHRKHHKQHFATLDVEIVIDRVFELHESSQLNSMYIFLRSLSRPMLDNCLSMIDDYCRDIPHKCNLVRKIILAYRSQFIKAPRTANDEDYIYCSVPFVHNVMEGMGLVDLFKRRDVKNYLPHSAKKFAIRTTFSYGPTIGSKLFNYNKVLNKLDHLSSVFEDCDCNTRYKEFVYQPHGHVHTGQLDIIENSQLRNVMTKGAKFRLTPLTNKTKLLTIFKESVSKLKVKLAKKSKLNVACFDLWEERILRLFHTRWKSVHGVSLDSNDIFNMKPVRRYLREFHDRFVVVPVDKASNNFAIICKKFYIQVLMKELGIQDNCCILGNDVYKYMNIKPAEFYTQQEKANKDLGNILEEDNRYIPQLYWISKQHKNPYKFRFISGASHCTNKTISKEVALALKCIKIQFKNYCAIIEKRTGLAHFWSIDNSTEFLNKISDISVADSIETYDFATLFTGLPLDNVYNNLEQLIIKMYNNSGSHGMMVNVEKKKAFWSHGGNFPGYKEYTIDKLLDALKFILNNTYVQFANNIFKQIKGIPMGGNASPFIADLYLAWHEFCFMDKLRKSKLSSDLKLAQLLSKNSRYIDDIAVVNYLNFDKIAKEIYGNALVLEGSSMGYHYDNFLDLNIRIHSSAFVIGIYHKVDDFNFEVINFPFPESNIHSKVGYNVFYSQLVRFFRLCNNSNDFLLRVKMIYNKWSGRGYDDRILFRYFLKFCSRYPVLLKFSFASSKCLWSASLTHSFGTHCAIFDHDLVEGIVRPCKVILTDINKDQLTQANFNNDNIAFSDVPLQITPSTDPERVNSTTSTATNVNTTTSPNEYTPIGLINPSNHCYLNSVLQVLQRMLSCHTQNIHINDSSEGYIVEKFILCSNPRADLDMSFFKTLLTNTDDFFDGSRQRDAHECFIKILDLFHIGTKENLISCHGFPVDEEFTTSLTKQLLFFSLERTLLCLTCGKRDVSITNLHSININPKQDVEFIDLILDSLSSRIIKRCEFCCADTNHDELLLFQQLPNILCVVINRFDDSSNSRKNDVFTYCNYDLKVQSTDYKLIGTVNHHGYSRLSGHYTSNVIFPGIKYCCNDGQITKSISKNVEVSNTAYIVLYAKSN